MSYIPCFLQYSTKLPVLVPLDEVLKHVFSPSFAQPRVYVAFLVWAYFRSCTLCSAGRRLEGLKEQLLATRTRENLGIQY